MSSRGGEFRAGFNLAEAEAGFSLIEVLVVMIVIGLLAAVAMPLFFNQREKADDAGAKQVAHSAQVAMEVCAIENGGRYDAAACDLAGLRAIEPALPTAEEGLSVSPGGNSYSVDVTAPGSGNTYSIARDEAGRLSYECTVAGSNPGGCVLTGEGAGSWGG